MGRSFVVLALVAGLGCAGVQGNDSQSMAAQNEDLSIRIEPSNNGWIIHTSRPATVALFEIVPNRGAGLLYPRSNKEGHLAGGSTRVVTEIGAVIKRHRSAYLAQRGTGGLVGSANLQLFESNTPRVVVAVACECSLRLDELMRPDGPGRILGSFSSVDAQSAGTKLVAAVIPGPEVTYALDRFAVGSNDW